MVANANKRWKLQKYTATICLLPVNFAEESRVCLFLAQPKPHNLSAQMIIIVEFTQPAEISQPFELQFSVFHPVAYYVILASDQIFPTLPL